MGLAIKAEKIVIVKNNMKYWKYATYDETGESKIVTLSEQEILDQYWNHWYTMMCTKFSENWVNENCTSQDCIDDWVVVNWAWES